MNYLKCIFVVCMFYFCCSDYAPAQEATVDVDGGLTFAWDANTESDLAGYHAYIGLSLGTYDNVIDVGNVTRYTATGLTIGTTYYIAVTASDIWDNESGYSNEISGVAKDIITPQEPKNLKEVTTNVNNSEEGD